MDVFFALGSSVCLTMLAYPLLKWWKAIEQFKEVKRFEALLAPKPYQRTEFPKVQLWIWVTKSRCSQHFLPLDHLVGQPQPFTVWEVK